MSTTLADMDIAEAKRTLSQCGPAAMYDYMEGFGDKYAALANGVARGGSLSGNAALRHMRAVAEKAAKSFLSKILIKFVWIWQKLTYVSEAG